MLPNYWVLGDVLGAMWYVVVTCVANTHVSKVCFNYLYFITMETITYVVKCSMGACKNSLSMETT